MAAGGCEGKIIGKGGESIRNLQQLSVGQAATHLQTCSHPCSNRLV